MSLKVQWHRNYPSLNQNILLQYPNIKSYSACIPYIRSMFDVKYINMLLIIITFPLVIIHNFLKWSDSTDCRSVTNQTVSSNRCTYMPESKWIRQEMMCYRKFITLSNNWMLWWYRRAIFVPLTCFHCRM